MREALSAYAGPMPRRVVPICRLPSRRSDAWSLVEEHLRVDDAPGADHRLRPRDDAARHLTQLPRLAVDDNCVPGIGAALIAAHDV
jgi:hypothetical protein